MAAPIETKAVAGPFVTLLAGYTAWALLYFVPGLDTALPSDIKGQLPVVVAGLLAAIATYLAPHTDRRTCGRRCRPPARRCRRQCRIRARRRRSLHCRDRLQSRLTRGECDGTTQRGPV